MRSKFGSFLLVITILFLSRIHGNAQEENIAPKPLYADPVYDGAADPVVIWNKKEKRWWMFYTNRRATIEDTTGVKWVHGTRIGIATSNDGKTWTYKDTANLNYRPDSDYTFWAP